MKKVFSFIMVALLVGAMTSCNGNGGSKTSKLNDSITTQMGKLIGENLKQMMTDPRGKDLDRDQIMRGIQAILDCDTSKKDQSYIQGLMIGMQMIYPAIAQSEAQGINIDRRVLMSEFKKAFTSKDSVNMEEIQTLQANLQGMMDRALKAKGVENDKEGQKYIAEQMKNDKGFKKTASGIAYKVIKPGKGENFNDSATVDVAYVGKHINGEEFDNSQGKPVPFNLKQVVPGFREVLTLMNEGAKVLCIIPGAQAYGDQGNPQGKIGPNETLVFEMTAVGLHKDDPNAMPGMPGNFRPASPRPAPGQGRPAPGPRPAPKPHK